MDKKINLEEIIQKCVGIRPGAKDTTPMDYGECKFVLRYFAEKLLELVAQNVEIVKKEYDNNDPSEYFMINSQNLLETNIRGELHYYSINKQSITNIIKLVE